MYKSSIILCVCLLLTGCKKHASVQNNESDSVYSVTQEGQDLFEIDIKDCVKHAVKEQVLYSQYFNSVEYVPLETTDESLIGNGRFSSINRFVSDRIIVADMKIFDRKTGKFLSPLSRRGGGPEEYLTVYSLATDDEREEIYFYSSGSAKIQIFGYDNTYKGTIAYSDEPTVISLGNRNLLLARGSSMEYSYDDYCVLNVDSKEVLYKHRSSAILNSPNLDECKYLVKRGNGTYIAPCGNVFWKYDGEVRYYDYLTDTVYAIKKNFEAIPVGYINMEGLKITREQWLAGPKADYWGFYFQNVIEGPEYIHIFIGAGNGATNENKTYWIVYHKDTKEIKTYLKDESVEYGEFVYNDLDDGMNFLFLNSVQEGCAGYFSMPASSMKGIAQLTKKGVIKKEKIYNPLLYDRYVKMVNDLKEDDNDVISIVTLK